MKNARKTKHHIYIYICFHLNSKQAIYQAIISKIIKLFEHRLSRMLNGHEVMGRLKNTD